MIQTVEKVTLEAVAVMKVVLLTHIKNTSVTTTKLERRRMFGISGDGSECWCPGKEHDSLKMLTMRGLVELVQLEHDGTYLPTK